MARNDDDYDDSAPGVPSYVLKALARAQARLAARPHEAEAVDTLLDNLERAAERTGAKIATVSLLAMRELGASLVAFGGVRSLRELMAALEPEIQRRAVELSQAPDQYDPPPAGEWLRLPRPPVKH